MSRLDQNGKMIAKVNQRIISGWIYLIKLLEKHKNHKAFDYLEIALTFIFSLAGILVSVNRFWQYEVFYYNFGIFDQAIWKVSRFQLPIIEHLLVGGKISLADHFDLSILLLSPIYWFTDRSEVLLVIQAIFAGLAGLVIYKIGTEILKDKLISFCLSGCYFFFVGIQNAVITDFHELTIMSLPISLTFYAIVKKKELLFWILFLLTLGFKEVTFALGIGIAIFIFFFNKSWRRQAIFAAIVASLWGFITIKLLIPFFSGGTYLHAPDLPKGVSDKIIALFDHPLKRDTLFFSFLNFGFLPLLSPSMWLVIIQDYVLRFLPENVATRWTLGLHYNAQVSPLLAIASIFGFKKLLEIKKIQTVKHLIAVLLLFSAIFQFRFVHHGPFLLAIHPVFYNHTKNFAFLDKLIEKVPKDASVMTQNNLGTRFTHQNFIYLRYHYESYSPDYVALDLREGQNPNNFLSAPELDSLINKLNNDLNYQLIYHEGDSYLYKKLNK